MLIVISSMVVTVLLCLFVPYWGPFVVPRSRQIAKAAQQIGQEQISFQSEPISEAMQKSRLGEKVVIYYDLNRRFDRIWNETQRQAVQFILMIIFISGIAIFLLQGLSASAGVEQKTLSTAMANGTFLAGVYTAIGIGEFVGLYMLYQRIIWARADLEPYLSDIEANAR